MSSHCGRSETAGEQHQLRSYTHATRYTCAPIHTLIADLPRVTPVKVLREHPNL